VQPPLDAPRRVIYAALGDSLWPDHGHLEGAVIVGVRMLVLDEIRSILAGTFREQRIVLNAIRFLANDLRISLVCVGTREAKQALMTDQ
jgi:hypothetical protein